MILMFYHCNYSVTPFSMDANNRNSLPQAAVDFVTNSLKLPDFQVTLIDQIKDREPEEQIVILNDSINELEELLSFLAMGKLTFQGLIGVALYLSKGIAPLKFPPELAAFATPFAGATFLSPFDSSKDYINDIIKIFRVRQEALEDEIEKIKMEEERIKNAPTPLAYQFIDSLETYLNSYKTNRSMFEQRQTQLNSLNNQLTQAKTEKEKERISADIEAVKARIEAINSDYESLNAQVMTVFNETLSNYSHNSNTPASIGPQYYPWIFELNNKLIELEDAGYELSDEVITYLSPILNLAEEIVNVNYSNSNRLDVFEESRWEKAKENLQPLFDISKEQL